MADITVYNQGEVDDSGKTNWRSGESAITPGSQSIYRSSSVRLNDLGDRKVVGDRVFRYARAGATIAAGEVTGVNVSSQIKATAAGTDGVDGKSLALYFATANAAGVYDEGYLIGQDDTGANAGITYRVKTQPVVATTTAATLLLYDPLKVANVANDPWSLFSNKYSNLVQNSAGTQVPAGIAPIAVTTNDYFWLQTWGPGAVKGSAVGGAGRALIAGATGQVQDAVIGTTGDPRMIIGESMQIMTASEFGLVFITIAP